MASLPAVALQQHRSVPFARQMDSGCQPIPAWEPGRLGLVHFQTQHGLEHRLHNLRQFARHYLCAQFSWHNVLSAGDVDGRVSHGLSFKPLLNAERRLGAAQQQPAASKQRAVEFFQDACFLVSASK